MKTQRLRIAALALLAALCASACSTTTPPAENVPPVEDNSNAAPSKTPPAGQVNPPAGQRDDGDAFSSGNVELSKKQPFLVLIRKNECVYCDRLSLSMRDLSKGEPRMLFFVLNLDDAKIAEYSKSINVDVTDNRKSNLPYATVFGANGSSPKPQFEVSGVKEKAEEYNAAVDVLKNAVAETRGGAGTNKDEINTLVKSEVAKQLGELKQALARDPDFQRSLLEDETFRADVTNTLLTDDKFRAGLVDKLSLNQEFKLLMTAGVINTKTVVAAVTLGLLPLLALALGLWNFWERRRAHAAVAALKSIEETPAEQHTEIDSADTIHDAGATHEETLITLRTDVDGIDARVKQIEDADAARSSAETKAAPDAQVRRAVLVTLKDVVAVAAEPARPREMEQEIEQAGLQLLGIIDRPVGDLRLNLQGQIDALKEKREEQTPLTHVVGGVTMQEVDEKLVESQLVLTQKIEKGDADLVHDMEALRTELLDKIASEMSDFQADLSVDIAQVGPRGTGKENGRGEEGAGMQASVAVVPQEEAPATRTDASGPGLPEEKAPELFAGTAPDAALLRGELDDLRRQVGTLGTLESRVENLEQQLRRSRAQMLKLWKRLTRMLKDAASQVADSFGNLRQNFVTQLAQQNEDDNAAREALEQKLDNLRESGEFAHFELTNTTRVTSQTVAKVVRQLLDTHEAKMASALPASDEGQAEAARSLEWCQKHLREVAAKVIPLVESVTELTETAGAAQKLPPGTDGELAEFRNAAANFGRLEQLSGERLNALRTNSARSVYDRFRAEREELERQFSAGEINGDRFSNESLTLLDIYAAAVPGGVGAAAGNEEVKSWASGAEDRLMDWYSDFFQLHTRLLEARRAGGAVDDAVIQGTTRTLKVAREVLSRFDIQPEEIFIGQTIYDGRMHDYALTRESSYPTHTIIEVWSSGFRRLRDGETLRRPRVVVAGTGSASGAA